MTKGTVEGKRLAQLQAYLEMISAWLSGRFPTLKPAFDASPEDAPLRLFVEAAVTNAARKIAQNLIHVYIHTHTHTHLIHIA